VSVLVLSGQVVGAESVALKLRGEAVALRARIGKTVQELGLETLRLVKGVYLSGAALNRKKGDLSRSTNAKYEEHGDSMTSSVGTNKVYARFWELGFSGTESVRQHLRRAPSGVESLVRAHERRVSVEARPFLQPALDDMGPRIHSALARASGASE
jgi:phage gpG-like protein